jgi:cholera toxin transcriptional activator
MTDRQPGRRFRFGKFEVNAATGELRGNGIRIKLNAQPFQLLSMLLERPGDLLTREEIARELWPDGTFVDYEHGVNSAVNRIREALGDAANNPRFIETLARRGYRFVAPVERIQSSDEKPASAPEPTTVVSPASQEAKSESPARVRYGILATKQDLPEVSHRVVQTLFLLLQLMYLAFYIGALANLAEIEELFSVLPRGVLFLDVLIVSAAVMIPVRAFLFCAALFHAPGAGAKFLRLWPFALPVDELWALSPFLLLHHINFGLALACVALLVYSPFAQRSLVLMGAGEANPG